MMWPFKTIKKYTSKFQQIIETVIKEDSVEKETFDPKLDSEMAKSVCYEMKNLGILSLSNHDIDYIIDSQNIDNSKNFITNDTIYDKRITIADLMLRSIMLNINKWCIKRYDDRLTLYLLKNDSFKIIYKNTLEGRIYCMFYDSQFAVPDNILIYNKAESYLKHLFLTPEFKQLTLAEQFIRNH